MLVGQSPWEEAGSPLKARSLTSAAFSERNSKMVEGVGPDWPSVPRGTAGAAEGCSGGWALCLPVPLLPREHPLWCCLEGLRQPA